MILKGNSKQGALDALSALIRAANGQKLSTYDDEDSQDNNKQNSGLYQMPDKENRAQGSSSNSEPDPDENDDTNDGTAKKGKSLSDILGTDDDEAMQDLLADIADEVDLNSKVKEVPYDLADYTKDAKNIRSGEQLASDLQLAAAKFASDKEYEFDRNWKYGIKPSYAYSDILVPAEGYGDPIENTPEIFVFIDQSGSWDARDVERGKEFLRPIADIDRDGTVKLVIRYFNTQVFDNAEDARYSAGYTDGLGNIIKEIKQLSYGDLSKVNVAIMTDYDFDDPGHPLSKAAPPIKVGGTVWWIIRGNRVPKKAVQKVTGEMGTYVYTF